MVKVLIHDKEGKVHDFYLDGWHKGNLDCIIKDIRKDFDAFVLYTGMEGYGKSTKAFQDAIYMDNTFNLSRVVFTAEQFLQAVSTADPYQAIVFDETMGYLSSRGAMSKFNRVLIKVMSEMRSKNLIILLCIPNFFMMDWYVAQHRSIGLIYIYRRGHFASYDTTRKKLLYRVCKKTHTFTVTPNFVSEFSRYFVLNKKEYEAKKQKAINEWGMGEESILLKSRDDIIKKVYEYNIFNVEEIENITNLEKRVINKIVKGIKVDNNFIINRGLVIGSELKEAKEETLKIISDELKKVREQ